MDAFELLKNDHKKVSQLFEEIESASGQAKTQLFSRLKRELDVHAHIEEKIFYPALENTDAAREITLEAYEEHKLVKDLLSELDKGRAADDEWDAKLTVLKENVEHHVEEEEGELFSKARQALSRDQIERFGTEMEAEKTRAQGGAARQTNMESERRDSPTTSQKNESPGVLQRIASLVGLGDSSESSSKKSRGSKSRGTTKKAAAKGRSSKQAAKSATKKSATRKSASKKSGTQRSAAKKTGSKTRKAGTAKRATKKSASKSSKRQTSVGARSSARKTAARRPGTSKKATRGGTKRSRAK